MKMNNCIGALWVSGALALTGCQSSNPLSYWGNYENAAYASYKKPGDATPEVQIAKLKEDLEKAAAKGLPPNPGLHAYLGYAYYEAGNKDQAAKEFEAEKSLYPDSGQFMDRLLAKLKTK